VIWARLDDGGIPGAGHAAAAGSELAQVDLGEDDRARVAKFPDDKGVGRWDRAVEQLRAAGRREIVGIEVVLQDDRNAVQRPTDFAGAALGIERAGFGEGVRVERNDRVDSRALFVVGGYPGEIPLREHLRGERAFVEGDIEVGDRGIRQIHRRTRLRQGGGAENSREKASDCRSHHDVRILYVADPRESGQPAARKPRPAQARHDIWTAPHQSPDQPGAVVLDHQNDRPLIECEVIFRDPA
jgi:hypothetical protein